ncbi:MAG: type IX secretion system membrane protein PorP/SprF [Flavobacteriaceae bacterium]
MRSFCLLLVLLCGIYASAQRVIVPDQELLYPFLNDPSFIGEGQRVQLTGLLQLTDSDFQHTTKWLNAQVSLYDNVSFGLDYFNDSFDFYDYTTVIFNTTVKVGLGDYNHYLKIGLGGGGESRKQDSRPQSLIPPGQNFVADVTQNNIEFIYKAGIHYRNKNITVGGYLNSLPIQDITQDTQNQLLHYRIEEGFTAYAFYNWRVADKIRVTPMLRYLSYLEDAIYEGAVRANYADKVEVSLSYKNDYAINPAFRVRVIKALDLGYSYEKAIGAAGFADVHGISASYKFFKADEEEPEWLRNAKDNIEEVAEIRKKKRQEKKAKKSKINEEVVLNPTEQEEARPSTEKPSPKETEKETPEEVERPAPKEAAVPEVEEKKAEPKEEVQEVEKATPAPKEEEKEAVVLESKPTAKPKADERTGILEKGFYIVVGTFESKAKAEAYMKSLDSSIYFPQSGRETAGGPLHVYIDSDISKSEANKRLRAHKLDKNFRNVRLLEVK